MTKTFGKTVWRTIRHSMGRFVAIAAIVALGVGFLTGLLATTPDMEKSVDAYFDEYNSCDINIKTATGFSADDLLKAQKIEGVNQVSPALVMDKSIPHGSSSIVARVHYLDMSDPKNQNNINRLQLLSGEFPAQPNECVVSRSGKYMVEYSIGDTITVDNQAYKVTGIVGSSWYFSNEREMSNVGNGRLGTVLYINSTNLPMYSDFFVTVDGVKNLNAFSDRYKSDVKIVSDRLNAALGENVFMLDRQSNVGFVTFKADAAKVAAVAVVFPAFFFLVAALVALTTMTRMVEEERTQIGTARALGYSKGQILSKYIIYSALSGLIGCVVGVLIGFQIFPAIVWNAFKFMFFLPPLTVHFNYMFAGLSSLAAFAAILVATIFACLKTLKEKPSTLMLPKSPKAGKPILLERVPFIWNHLKFKHKSTIRNLFRYKKHFIMTVVGIAGCTALMLTGFGLKDSMDNLTKTQYNKIINYDLTVNYTGEVSGELSTILHNDGIVTDYSLFYSENGYIVKGDTRESVQVVVPSEPEGIDKYVTLKPRNGNKNIEFDASSVVLTESIAKALNIKKGDAFTYELVGGAKQEFVLGAITENYVGNYLYLGANLYDKPCNTVLANTPKIDTAALDEVMTSLLKAENVSGAQFTAVTRTTYDSLIESIGLVVVLLIISAGALAVIVLYNLININIQERTKELATLKVLGYRGSEVAGYVFREIFILTIVGILVGFALGALLHWFVIINAETVEMMFGRAISPLSFLFSALLTLGFSLLVDFIMYFRLKKINMIESMKAAE